MKYKITDRFYMILSVIFLITVILYIYSLDLNSLLTSVYWRH